MSYAMDDTGILQSAGNALKVEFLEKTRMIKNPPDVNNRDFLKKESEVGDDYKTEKRHATEVFHEETEKLQEKSVAIDIATASLREIKASIKEIKTETESENSETVSQKLIDEKYEEIIRIAKESSFNEKELIKISEEEARKESAEASLEGLKITDIEKLEIKNQEQREESAEKVDEIIKNIEDNEQELVQKSNAVSININSVIEIKIVPEEDETAEVPKKESMIKLKETVLEGIKQNPVKNRDIHIKHLDRNLLLAMISLSLG